MDFHDFSKVLGKSGVSLIHPPTQVLCRPNACGDARWAASAIAARPAVRAVPLHPVVRADRAAASAGPATGQRTASNLASTDGKCHGAGKATI